MLNFLQISLTSRCNFSCWHCPMADYRNVGSPEFALRNDRLIPWLQSNVDPNGWVIELTGGEPSLYVGIDELVEWLSKNSYKTVIKTNGSGPIASAPKVIRVAAFHRLNDPPRYFDKILVVDTIDSEEKMRICEENGWEYKLIGLNRNFLPGDVHHFAKCAYMDPHGHPLPCKATKVKYTEWPDRYALEFTGLKKTLCCKTCKAAVDCWKFLPDSWK